MTGPPASRRGGRRRSAGAPARESDSARARATRSVTAGSPRLAGPRLPRGRARPTDRRAPPALSADSSVRPRALSGARGGRSGRRIFFFIFFTSPADRGNPSFDAARRPGGPAGHHRVGLRPTRVSGGAGYRGSGRRGHGDSAGVRLPGWRRLGLRVVLLRPRRARSAAGCRLVFQFVRPKSTSSGRGQVPGAVGNLRRQYDFSRIISNNTLNVLEKEKREKTIDTGECH